MPPISVIIDTDPGVDDFLAIALALNSLELAVEALTTVGGNAALRHTNANALRTLELLGRPDIPVYRGSARPLKGSFGSAEDVHGDKGLPVRFPRPGLRNQPQPAVAFLVERLADSGTPVTLIALGPLTNVARLVRRYPAAAEKVQRLVVMGGAVDVPGNVTPHAEFNIWSDPEAAELVFSSGLPLALVGRDVCHRVTIEEEDAGGLPDPIIRNLLRAHFSNRPSHPLTLYDPLTVMAVVDPTILTVETTPIRVDTGDGPERGRTQRDPAGHRVTLAVDVDEKAARTLFRDRVLTATFNPAEGAPAR